MPLDVIPVLGPRRRGALRHWTTVEERVLRDLYPEGGTAAVHRALPHRSVRAIGRKAIRLGVKTTYHWRREL
jgi:hypothetical protein